MTTPASGLITLTDIGFEAAITVPYTLTKLYGKIGAPASGLIKFTDFYGKSNAFTFSITTSIASPDIHARAISAGWNGTAPLICNLNCPYVCFLSLNGSKTFPGGLTVNILTGCLVGGSYNGGTAIYARVPVTIANYGTIAGGGGAGGRGAIAYAQQSTTDPRVYSFGSGGRGKGFASATSTIVLDSTVGDPAPYVVAPGETVGNSANCQGGNGGAGGGWGATGSGGVNSYTANKGSGYAAGVDSWADSGSPAGKYIDGNSYVTWLVPGVRMGNVA